MKKIIILSLIYLLGLQSFGQGIEFFHGTWKEVKAEAKKQNKKIFIDFYTKWCGPCRVIAKNVFPIPAVGEVYNTRFINYKVDAEVGEGPMLAKKYNVKGYPTFAYLNADGSVIWCGDVIGYGNEKGLIELADIAIGKKVKSWEQYKKEYEGGRRDTEFLKEYMSAQLKALNMPPNEKLKFELLKSYPEKEWFEEENRNLIFYNAQVGNEFYEILITNKDKFPQLTDNHKVVGLIYSGLMTAKWDSTKNVEEFKVIYKKDFPNVFDQAMTYCKIDDLRFQNKPGEYVKQMFKYIDKYGEPENAGFGLGFSSTGAEKISKKHAKRCLKYYEDGLNSDPPHFYSISSYAYLLYKSGEQEKAQELAKKYDDLTNSYSDSKKMKWSYDTMKYILEGEEPRPNKR